MPTLSAAAFLLAALVVFGNVKGLETPENGKGGEWNIQKVQELRQNE